jgi:hypothetical protein
MAGLHARILADYEDWNLRLTPVIVGVCLMAAAVLLVLRLALKPGVTGTYYAAGATSVGILALLIAPTIWASYQVFQGPGANLLPVAGPPLVQASADKFGGSNTQGSSSPNSAFGNAVDPTLLHYLLAHQGDANYLVAATSSRNTAPIILSTDKPVISLGGYNGLDPVFTTKQLADLVNKGAVRFFLMPDRELMATSDGAPPQGRSGGVLLSGPDLEDGLPQNGSAGWVQDNCKRVPRKRWQSSTLRQGGEPWRKVQMLYDCRAGRR